MINNCKHILIIRLSALGDVAMSIPVINVLKESYPDLKITVLTKPFYQNLFKDIEGIHFFTPDLNNSHKGFLGIKKLANELSLLDIDYVADFHNVLRSNLLIRFLKLKGIPFEQINKGRSEKKKLINNSKSNKNDSLISTHTRYANVLKTIGFNIDINNFEGLPKNSLPAFIRNQTNNSDSLIGIAPFAAHSGKMYPLHYIKELSELIVNQFPNSKLLIFGGGNSEKKEIDTLFGNNSNIINTIGKMSFKEELDVISNLKVMVSMDSGNGHLAAIYNIPVITIWGITHPSLGFVPFNQPKDNQILPDLKQYPLIPTSVYGKKYPKDYLSCFDTINKGLILNQLKKYL